MRADLLRKATDEAVAGAYGYLARGEEFWSPLMWGDDPRRCLLHAVDAAIPNWLIRWSGDHLAYPLVYAAACDRLAIAADGLFGWGGDPSTLGDFNDSHSYEDVLLVAKHAAFG